MASFAIDEEELMGSHCVPLPHTPTTPSHSTQAQSTEVARKHTDKSWEEIIPEEELARVRAVEDQQEQLQLYLPPRQRKVKVGTTMSVRAPVCVRACVYVHVCTQSYAEEQYNLPGKGSKKGQAPPPGRRVGGVRKAERGGRDREADGVVEVDVEGFSVAEIRRWVGQSECLGLCVLHWAPAAGLLGAIKGFLSH